MLNIYILWETSWFVVLQILAKLKFKSNFKSNSSVMLTDESKKLIICNNIIKYTNDNLIT